MRKIAIIVAAIAILAVAGCARKGIETGAKLEITPSSVRPGEEIKVTVSVANGKTKNLRITGLTSDVFQNGEFVGSYETSPAELITKEVPPGKTAIILKGPLPAPPLAGVYKVEMSVHTNFGDLKTTAKFTVTP